MVRRILYFFEQQSFGVCSYIGERFSISISKLRLFFIYATIIGVGFPLIMYFMAGIILDFRSYVRRIRSYLLDS
ncbi:PspC family transcriptional regulator [Sphingobacteriaceae bacterium WQ 2009]|uniref:PspC family transcriptional regulator n=1 Tax=Rhinopithecimicrobium faecis TaxID=2820698 RepID=A0A8T4H9T9_9SPHI|nr:PspC family transcriptional regulator [Sphingobacteriaceae bacterium WQ 2009]